MDVTVAPCRSLDELRRAMVISRYFGNVADEERAERFSRNLPLDRMLAAWEGEDVVGGAGAFPFELSVPGGRRVAAGGVTVVGVLPTHRRRGVLTALMRAQLDDLRGRGEPVAFLWASEGTIYGRFGYGIASLQVEISLARERTAFAAPAEPYGRTRLVSREEALAAFPAVYECVLEQRPGMFARTEAWWRLRRLRRPDEEAGSPRRFVALELDGKTRGYAIYRTFFGFEGGSSSSRLVVQEALGTTPQATAEIWRYLLDVDWMASVEVSLAPPDHPLFLLLASPRRVRYRMGDGLWMRVVDVGAALSGRAYADGPPLVLEVRDAVCDWNDGRWKLEDGDCARTDAEPDLALDASALGAAYLGAVPFAQLRDALLLEELRDGAVARADRLFAWRPLPWCPEIF